ncbi:hypothetical protein [Sphingomonas qomolangmaensis]|uniref:Uncharacterized protein n=1 Tax=Sphingomonas qomolangmaensis TaxID=2918765 RepID=A0ABY5LD22_9SPHN|nr:hypothetical protein [Sphingomonas qomolangmaensis]UUL84006.1 hypothetical protein NMP03_07415 [Sphingomonas qomolangmaensis]
MSGSEQAPAPNALTGRVAEQLPLCRGCRQFTRPGERECPFCGGDVAALASRHAHHLSIARAAARDLSARIAAGGKPVDDPRQVGTSEE